MLDSVHRAPGVHAGATHDISLSPLHGKASDLFRSHLSASLSLKTARADVRRGTALRSVLARGGSTLVPQAAMAAALTTQRDLLSIHMDQPNVPSGKSTSVIAPAAASLPDAAPITAPLVANMTQGFDTDSVTASILNQQARFVDTANTLKVNEYTQGMANWRAQCSQVKTGQLLPLQPTPPTLAVFDAAKYKAALFEFARQGQDNSIAGKPVGEFNPAVAFTTTQYQPSAGPSAPDAQTPPVISTNTNSSNPIGISMGRGTYAAAAGDTSADGTIYTASDAGGTAFVKHVAETPFGLQGWWTLQS